MRLAVIVPFLNEAVLLPVLLRSIADQTRTPDLLLLVDDGSTDGSVEIAEAFAEQHEFARVLTRPPRAPEKDRLATAAELRAFHWALEQLPEPFDVVAKMDADLRLVPSHMERVLGALAADDRLGVCGTFLATEEADGSQVREQHPVTHVRGPNKFYRRACLDQIEPLPEILGWDTFDDLRARQAGWRTQSVECAEGDSVHMRPTGTHDGRLRAYRRWGRCAWGWGAHPLYVLMGGAYRMRQEPRVVAGLSYIWGYIHAGLQRAPRVDANTRRYARTEEKARMRRVLSPGQRGLA